MIDPANDQERAERIRRLQARRATPARAKQHPAAATRWLLGGLSIASFFTIAGTVAVANQSDVASTPAAPAQSGATATAPKSNQPSAAAPASSQTSPTNAPAPHTTTRGS